MRRAENLSEHSMYSKSLEILEGKMTDAEIKIFLESLHEKGETADEMVGLVRAMHSKAMPLPETDGPLIDVCGTGGDRSFSFNISTLTAFVLAGCGMKVAKHGNRSVSSKTGSADVLEELGISTTLDPALVPDLIEKTGIAFLFAPAIHPSLGKLRDVRRSIAAPTIFNLAGPLANPLPIEMQMTGVYRRDMMEPMADALMRLGRKRGVMVHGAGGMDELSLAGVNDLLFFDENGKKAIQFHPEEAGLELAPTEAVRGGDARRNAEIFLEVLEGREGAYLDTVALNAGTALFANSCARTIAEGVHLARKSLISGETDRVFEAHRQAMGVVV